MRLRLPEIRWSWSLPATVILYFVVAGAPFPFGSTNDLSIAFWCLCLGIAVMFAPTRDLRRSHLWLLAGIGVIVTAYAFVLHEQLSDHPWIAPFQPIWKQASDLLGVPIAPSASIVKNEAFFALGAPLANILAIVLGITVGADRMRARRLLWVLAISGAAYALYGVLSFLIEPTMILWRDKTAYLGSVTGTFINRNTAAAYFGSCGVVWMLLILGGVRRRLPEPPIDWSRLSLALRTISLRAILPQLAGLLICLMAMFMTGSRAGVSLSLLAMIISVTVFLKKDLPSRAGIWISLAAGGMVALGLMHLVGGRVSGRFDSQGLVDEGRIEAWKLTLRIISENPWFGTGIGTFRWASPPLRGPGVSIRGVWDIAHSTPLELASDVGIPLAVLVAAAWMTMCVILVLGFLNRRRDTVIPLAAVSIAGLSMLHSCLDFTLQIPGYSIPFLALLGAGLAQSFRSLRTPAAESANSSSLRTKGRATN
ncbi:MULTISPECIES: O-antigen ligase family protein [unclassified Bradyrhizobium]|uniref:O-antigen ligase family protein n=1 Tax=unclassified Bradyrhizobium TaxID=2631580 RepID=UPI00211DBC80|nr:MULTISPECIES: O-antigen ligase family protein [unclassified Bradyrhizobium]MDD1532473.1 O-antigen ligase domain-containing protein [Bradyrhizobium sp. WBOS8]MDD1582477.1 O-antigen ligase domain-containing protein [Bradyrhizobium sp. WBOS4]UUO50877.1 O-antigen ligase domain-containing protein [Bradyrhizobium sp. WBOS04]UUO58256.1 O-antigen ligase domain-containing protein [Bradyrhizobium sp. WBOS08]